MWVVPLRWRRGAAERQRGSGPSPLRSVATMLVGANAPITTLSAPRPPLLGKKGIYPSPPAIPPDPNVSLGINACAQICSCLNFACARSCIQIFPWKGEFSFQSHLLLKRTNLFAIVCDGIILTKRKEYVYYGAELRVIQFEISNL